MTLIVFSFLSDKELPTAIKDNLDIVLSDYTKNIDIKFEKLEPMSPGFFKELKSLSLYEYSMIGILLLSFCFFTFFGFYKLLKGQGSGEFSQIGTIISENVEKLRASLDNLSLSSGGQGQDFSAKTKPLSFEINSGEDTFSKDFSLESLEEVLMDCYWSQEDAYASFLWSKIDILRKGHLLAQNSKIGNYANFITNIEKHDKKFLHETYYFNPLSLSDIPNTNLTKLVKKYNSIFHLLPKIRIESLELDAIEKKKLLLKKYSKKDTEFELPKYQLG